ncbi:MAG: hypothetical protein NZ805_00945 [Armatimonadetes bacterium]|nr:hypothetical protein [Armatimonadota bacterium]MDW8027641.1 hypothetical protein [Armatimonadota bacterium]
MKRIWTPMAFLALVTLTVLKPNLSAQSLQLEVSFDERSGGLLSLMKIPEVNLPQLTGMVIYTDWGILRPEHYEPIGSQNENKPKVSEKTLGRTKLVIVEGKLKDKQSQPSGLRYRVVHRLNPNTLSLDIFLSAERTFKSMRGFLAVMLNFKGANEWFAHTQKGWMFAEIVSDGRLFQSIDTPIDSNNPILGVANSKTGWAIALTLKKIEPKDSIENVLIHANRQGSGGIFLAWCDGISMREMGAGETWFVSFTLKLLRTGELTLSGW